MYIIYDLLTTYFLILIALVVSRFINLYALVQLAKLEINF